MSKTGNIQAKQKRYKRNILKRDRQYNGQQQRDNKRTNNDLCNTTQKTKDQATRSLTLTGVNSNAPEG